MKLKAIILYRRDFHNNATVIELQNQKFRIDFIAFNKK